MKSLKIYSLALLFISVSIFAAPSNNQNSNQSITRAAAAQMYLHAKDAYQWPVSDFEHLDVSIYWVTKNDKYCPADQSKSAKIPGCENASAYFDPKKPTVIFFHGWEPFSTYYVSRFDFYTTYPDSNGETKDIDLGKIWRDKGWNVGVFYWNQISDTNTPAQAAAKIWSTKTTQAMDWEQYFPAGKYAPAYTTSVNACSQISDYCKPVGELAFEAYVNAMKNYQGNDIRLVGHSLGGQLVINVTHKIAKNVAAGNLSPRLLPRQMVLLDPFFTLGGNSYLAAKNVNIDNQALADQYVDDIANKYGITVSEFLSSILTIQQNWSKIEDVAALTEYYPDFVPSYDEPAKHSAAWLVYFWSLADQPPVSYYKPMNGKFTQNDKNAYPAISASTPIFINGQNNPSYGVAAAMEEGIYFDQDCLGNLWCGQDTANPAGDGFLQAQVPGAPSQIVDSIDVYNNGGKIAANSTFQLALSAKTRFIASPLSAGNMVKHIVLWQSSNDKVVTTFPGGYVKAVGPGTAVITATAPALGYNTPATFSFTIQVD